MITDLDMPIRPLKIGNILFNNNLFLAPMAGICLKPFRLEMKRLGAGVVCNEMVSSYGICYHNKKTLEMLDVFDEKERPVSVQVFGDNPDIIAESCKILVDKGIEFLDINMGCPAPNVVNGGAGSALLKDLDKIRLIVKKVRSALSIPFSVKIRTGWDLNSVNACEVAQIVEGEGADAIIVHARTRSQKFNDFDWSMIGKVKSNAKIPVIGNGSIFSPIDVKKMYEMTNCDGFMIGRATCSNPWIFRQILEYFEKGKFEAISDEERLEYLKNFAYKFVEYRGEKGIFEVRKFIVWLTKSMPNSSELRRQFFEIKELTDIEKVIERYRSIV